MPRRPASSSLSSHSGGSKVVLGEGAGIAMNVSVSMETAGACRRWAGRLVLRYGVELPGGWIEGLVGHSGSAILIRRPPCGSFLWQTSPHRRRESPEPPASAQENLRTASSVKTHFKRLEAAISSGDDATAETEHKAARLAHRQGRPARRDAPEHRRPQEVPRGQAARRLRLLAPRPWPRSSSAPTASAQGERERDRLADSPSPRATRARGPPWRAPSGRGPRASALGPAAPASSPHRGASRAPRRRPSGAPRPRSRAPRSAPGEGAARPSR